MTHTDNYFNEVTVLTDAIDKNKIEKMAEGLKDVSSHAGRVFVLGVWDGGNMYYVIRNW